MNLAAALDEVVRAECPIAGVSIGNESDRTSWTFAPEEVATAEQRAAAQEILDNFPWPPEVTKDDLTAYANAKQWDLATGGYTTTIGGQALTFATDATSFALITGKAVRLQQPGAPATTNWQFANGFITVPTPEFIEASVKIADFMQATFDSLQPVIEGINAGATTTFAEIDAASWPESHH